MNLVTLVEHFLKMRKGMDKYGDMLILVEKDWIVCALVQGVNVVDL